MPKNPVSDGQLGQLAVKQHELFRRAKQGTFANFDAVLDAVQSIIEGKPPELPLVVVDPKLAPWRPFIIGGFAAVDLQSMIHNEDSSPEPSIREIVCSIRTQPNEEQIETIILTPADFGYKRRPVTTELLDPTRLADWSEQNAHRLPEGYVVGLLPPEAGPQIYDQYKDQPNGEVLLIPMERIISLEGYQYVFAVERDHYGKRWLKTQWAHPDHKWSPTTPFVFRLRKVTQG